MVEVCPRSVTRNTRALVGNAKVSSAKAAPYRSAPHVGPEIGGNVNADVIHGPTLDGLQRRLHRRFPVAPGLWEARNR
jgi:hypothetical protein